MNLRYFSHRRRNSTTENSHNNVVWLSRLLQVAAKRRSEEARSLQGSWFPSVMRRTLIMVQGKEGGEMPTCMTKLAAALHKVARVFSWARVECIVHVMGLGFCCCLG